MMDCPFTVRQGSRDRSLSVGGQSGIYSKNPTVCYEAGGRRLCSNLQAPVQHLGEVGQPLNPQMEETLLVGAHLVRRLREGSCTPRGFRPVLLEHVQLTVWRRLL